MGIETIYLDDDALRTASDGLANLKTRTETLKVELESIYHDLTTALDTPAGKAVDYEAKDVILEPIDNMLLVIKHVSDTLRIISGKGYYADLFTKFEELNNSIQ